VRKARIQKFFPHSQGGKGPGKVAVRWDASSMATVKGKDATPIHELAYEKEVNEGFAKTA
jgi:hypothetical protein